MKTVIRITLLLCVCCPIMARAQITFQWTDLPINAGTVIDYVNSDVLSPISLDPGSAGHQNWDFTNISVSESFQHRWLDPTTTPHIGLYPTANRCFTSDDVHYGYYCLTSAGLWWCGQDTTVYQDGEPVYTFPCTYGDTWTTSWWTSPYPQVTVENEIDYEVDGWGTITDQLGTFNCLRIKRHLTITMTTPWMTTVMTYWGYDWFVPGYGDLVMMESNIDEPDPYFTQGYFRRIVGINTGVRPFPDQTALPNQVTLSPAYPNPFNPSTQINFSLPKPGDVSLVIFDQLGRQVAQLAEGRFTAGQYQATFEGSRLASGLYLATLRVDGAAYTQKLVLMK
jgi:hypothetical protein